MKLVIILTTFVLFLSLVVIGYIYLSEKNLEQIRSVVNTPTILTGNVQKVFDAEVEYTHLLKTPDSVVPINSSTITLDEFIGGTVEVIGYYSGKTLYVDSITEKK